MAKDEVHLALTEYVREVAKASGEASARLVIREHLELCEARKKILPHDGEPGICLRVDRLEQTAIRTIRQVGFWWRVAERLVVAAVLAIGAALIYVCALRAGLGVPVP